MSTHPDGPPTFPTTADELRRAPMSVWAALSEVDPTTYARLRDEVIRLSAVETDSRRPSSFDASGSEDEALERFRRMPLAERTKLATDSPDEYRRLADAELCDPGARR